MLSQEEKDRIVLEETYRHEVRQRLEARQHKRESRLWGFLNSSFGLFLLSSVGLSLISLGYSHYTNSLHERSAAKGQVKKLEYELASRVSMISKMTDTCNADDMDNIRYAIKGNHQNTKTVVFEAFENKGLFSLLYEYKSLQDQELSSGLYAAITDLQPLFDKLDESYVNSRRVLTPVYRQRAAGLLKVLQTWKSS